MKFVNGDVVVIRTNQQDVKGFDGLRCQVIDEKVYDSFPEKHIYVEPLSSRPDGHGTTSFFWPVDELHLDSDNPEGWSFKKRPASVEARAKFPGANVLIKAGRNGFTSISMNGPAQMTATDIQNMASAMSKAVYMAKELT